MIILEGPDCVGKTTLANNLFEHSDLQDAGYIYAHFTRLPRGFRSPKYYLERMSQRVIQDRFHISELVYCKFNGKHSIVSQEGHDEVNEKLKGSSIVVLTADEQLLVERFESEREMYSVETVLEANNRYFKYLKGELGVEPYRNILHYHFTRDNLYPCDQVVAEIAREEMRCHGYTVS